MNLLVKYINVIALLNLRMYYSVHPLCISLSFLINVFYLISPSKAGGTALDLVKLFGHRSSVVRYVCSFST